MADGSLQDQIDAASGYESLLVPALFEQWTQRVIDAALIRPGQKVLDVACGTGVLARAAARRVGLSGFVAGIDPDAGMLTIAARLDHALEWRSGVAEALPYADESFDALVSQFGLMFFRDRQRSLQEMVRVLTRQGRLAVAVWDSVENLPAYATEVSLLDRLAGTMAADAMRAPFSLGAKQDLVKLFEDAGLEQVTITTHVGSGRFTSVRAMVEADLRGWLPIMGVVLTEELIHCILAEAEDALRRYVTSDGRIEFDVSAHIVAASKP